VFVCYYTKLIRKIHGEGKIYQLSNMIQTHSGIGMVLLDDSLVDLFSRRIISLDTVYAFCRDPKEVENIISGGPVSRKARRR
jgi:Tfp pilus assembly pilus retraction ATPase PilT